MQWEAVIGLETHTHLLNAAHRNQTVADWHQSIPDA